MAEKGVTHDNFFDSLGDEPIEFVNSDSDTQEAEITLPGQTEETTEEVTDTVEETTEETSEEETETTEETEEDNETKEEHINEDSLLPYVDFLQENNMISELSEEDRETFSGMSFEEQTEKLQEIQQSTIENGAKQMFDDYVADRPLQLQIIEQNYEAGMSVEDAIKFALEAPTAYDPQTDADINEQLEEKIVYNAYLDKLQDKNKAEMLTKIDKEAGSLTENAKKISKEQVDSWNIKQEQQLEAIKKEENARVAAYDKQKQDVAELLNKSDYLVPGLKLDKKAKIDIFNSAYAPVKTENGVTSALQMKIDKNPEKFIALQAYLFGELDLLNDPKGFEKIFKVGKTTQAKEVVKKLKVPPKISSKRKASASAKPKDNGEILAGIFAK